MLNLDGPAFEAFAVLANLPHTGDPDAHVQLENRFFLKMNGLKFFWVLVFTECTWRMHPDWEEALLVFLFMEIAVNEILHDVADHVDLCEDTLHLLVLGC
jgi:hypothetical protein